MSNVLTLDLGTSSTKAGVWIDAELVAFERAPLNTSHPRPGWAEQDPDAWWESVVSACVAASRAAGARYADIDAICFSAARETFALVDRALRPLGPAVLWSDQRAAAEANELADAAAFRQATGVVLNGAAHAAKVAWVARHRSDEFRAARWIVAPRDLVVARLTGEVVTDLTLASRTGWWALGGGWTPDAHELLGDRLPPVLRTTAVVGPLRSDAAEELGLPTRTNVVLGGGDRACEVIGTGATTAAPVVSWGTTANVSVPHDGPLDELPRTAAVSCGALTGYLVEAGLSASGAALAWLAELTGRDHDALLDLAAGVEPGARGVIALPWLHGARAPWWRAEAHAAFIGLTSAHGPAELARATLEAVAFDVARCLELLAPDAVTLALAGGGAGSAVWREIVAGVTGRGWTRRRYDDAASVGARLVVVAALGETLTCDDLNPQTERGAAEAGLTAGYREVGAASDDAARTLLGPAG